MSDSGASQNKSDKKFIRF